MVDYLLTIFLNFKINMTLRLSGEVAGSYRENLVAVLYHKLRIQNDLVEQTKWTDFPDNCLETSKMIQKRALERIDRLRISIHVAT